MGIDSGTTLREHLLALATEDWIDGPWLLEVVRRTGVTEPEILRDLALGLLDRTPRRDRRHGR